MTSDVGRVVPITQAKRAQEGAKEALHNQLSASFDNLFKYAQNPHPDSPGQVMPSTGPWGLPISYCCATGSVRHAAGDLIDLHRPNRAFTTNAVELRCDCLSLCIYVSGVAQLAGKGDVGTRHARVVGYVREGIKPFVHCAIDSPLVLLDRLHEVLRDTFNQLAREHNLAGFPGRWLSLQSSNPSLIPHIPICLGRTAHA